MYFVDIDCTGWVRRSGKCSSFKIKPGQQDLGFVQWAGLACPGQTGMKFRVNPVSGKVHRGKRNKNKTHSASSNSTVHAFLAALHSSFMICRCLRLPSMIFASLARSQLACLLNKQATGYYMLQIGSGIKEKIQSAFKCTRIYYPI